MKKKVALMLSALMCSTMVFSACGKDDSKTLYIEMENAGYGIEWIDPLIDMFESEHPGIEVKKTYITKGSKQILGKVISGTSNIDISIVEKLRIARPDIQISSDFIVGFPDESDSDFDETLQIAKRIGYINSYCFKYSPRPHTGAALLPNQIPENIKASRLALLDNTLNEIQRSFNISCIDKTLPCLYEGPDKTGLHAVYRTPYMQQCIVSLAGKSDAPTMANITITDANKASLRGKFAE